VVHREKEEELRDEIHRLRDELNSLREMLICLGDQAPSGDPKKSPNNFRFASDESGDAFTTRAAHSHLRSDSDSEEERGRVGARERRAARRLDFDEIPVRDTDPDAAQVPVRNGTEKRKPKRTYADESEIDKAWSKHELKRQAACLEAIRGQMAEKDCELAEARIKLVEAKTLAREASGFRKREEGLRREIEEVERERDDLKQECAALRARLKREGRSWREEERWGRKSPRSSLDRHSRRRLRNGFEHDTDGSRCDSDCTECEEDMGAHRRRRRDSARHGNGTEYRQRVRGSERAVRDTEERVRELQERLAHSREEKRDLQSEMERMRKQQSALETELTSCRSESSEKVDAIREERRFATEQLSIANEKLTRARRRIGELEAQVELLRAEVARSAARHPEEAGPELIAVMARARRAEKELHEMRGLVARLREEAKRAKSASRGGDPLGDVLSMPFRFEGVITSPR
jgi:hypothetical protein